MLKQILNDLGGLHEAQPLIRRMLKQALAGVSLSLTAATEEWTSKNPEATAEERDLFQLKWLAIVVAIIATKPTDKQEALLSQVLKGRTDEQLEYIAEALSHLMLGAFVGSHVKELQDQASAVHNLDSSTIPVEEPDTLEDPVVESEVDETAPTGTNSLLEGLDLDDLEDPSSDDNAPPANDNPPEEELEIGLEEEPDEDTKK